MNSHQRKKFAKKQKALRDELMAAYKIGGWEYALGVEAKMKRENHGSLVVAAAGRHLRAAAHREQMWVYQKFAEIESRTFIEAAKTLADHIDKQALNEIKTKIEAGDV